MHFTPAIATAILLFGTVAVAAPVPQLAGEGAAANSILSDTDNGIGYGIENAEDNIAALISGSKSGSTSTGGGSAPPPPPPPAMLRIRQLAGEGAAADSILTDTDNGIGYGVENAEDNIAADISGAKSGSGSTGSTGSTGGSGGSAPPPPPPKGGKGPKVRRQLAGEGAAADSILSDTDNGIGYGTENAEDNIAALISGTKSGSGSTGGSAPPPPPPPGPKARRQLDKIANGFKAIGDAAGVSTATDPVGNAGDSIDGELTGDAANAGAQIGSTEETTLEDAGSSVPKARRQLDKIANGLKAIGDAAGASAVTTPVGDAGDSLDGTLTSDAANAGAQIGSTEETILENAGSSVPKARRQLDKIANGFKAIGDAAGVSAATTPVGDAGDSIDGELTGDAANAGAQIGSTEESTLENAGSSVPKL